MELILGVFLGIGIVFLTKHIYNVVKENKKKQDAIVERKEKESKFKKEFNSIMTYTMDRAISKREV